MERAALVITFDLPEDGTVAERASQILQEVQQMLKHDIHVTPPMNPTAWIGIRERAQAVIDVTGAVDYMHPIAGG